MTGRERINLAVQHKETDRVPIDCGAIRSSGIAAQAYVALLKSLQIEEPVRMFDFQQQLAYPGKKIRERFHIDAVNAGQGFLLNDADWKPWVLNNGDPCKIPAYLNLEQDKDGTVRLNTASGLNVGVKTRNSLYTNQTYWPYGDLPAIPEQLHQKDLQSHLWSVPCSPFHLDIDNESQYRKFLQGLKQFYQNTEEAVTLSLGFSLFEVGSFLRKLENFLVDIYTDRRGTERLLDYLLDIYMRKLDRMLPDISDSVDIITFGDDLGTQDNLWIAPELVEELFIPRYKKMWDYVHSNSDCKVFLHSCGAICSIIGKLIDAGLDILNPVQTSAAGMEPEKLKKEFGNDITFWGGGCDTKEILPFGTPEEVRTHVKRRIELFSRNGGFVFNQIHNIQANIPPENIIALYDAACE
ncbi:MAG: methyltransferase [Spirochaetia bacterium]|nr:methyltransferase [Spirochaetia bacterium]